MTRLRRGQAPVTITVPPACEGGRSIMLDVVRPSCHIHSAAYIQFNMRKRTNTMPNGGSMRF